MNCKKVLSRLDAYVDGEAPSRLVPEMEKHLRTCASCRGQVEQIRRMGARLDHLIVPPVPHEFAARVMAEARKKTPSPRSRKLLTPSGWQPLEWFRDLSAPMRLAACAVVLFACSLGMIMSKELSTTSNGRVPLAVAESLEGFEWFSPGPPASLGSAYYALAAPPQEACNVE